MGQLKSSFTTAERLERALDMPVIGTISRSVTAARAPEKRRMKQFFAGVGGLGAVCLLLLVVEIVQVGSVA